MEGKFSNMHLDIDEIGRQSENRPQWGSRMEFVLTLVGYAVGIGNVWRFPYLCFENGGAVFLIPYLIVVTMLGIPLFALEIAVGQCLRKGSLESWGTFHPTLFAGLGPASVMVTLVTSLYYNVIIAWAILYLGYSFQSPLPWKEELDSQGNVTMDSHIFFQEDVLHMSDNINNPGALHWNLIAGLTAAWIIIFFIIFKGIESSGKVVYFTATFPYLVLLIMVIRGVSLDGAAEGLKFYLVPKWGKLANPVIWAKAGEQVFFSLGVGFGSLVTFGSFNKRDHDFVADAFLVPCINACTSFFAGFAVFGTAGYLAKKDDVEVEDLDLSGAGLAFELYPTALAGMDASNVFAVLFFFMLLLLGVDSQFAMTETVVTALIDSQIVPARFTTPDNKYKVIIVVCVLCWCVGLLFTSEAGIYFVNVVNGLSSGFTLFAVACLEATAVSHFYGVERFIDDCKQMVGPECADRYPRTWEYFHFAWKYSLPVLCGSLVIVSFVIVVISDFSDYVCSDDTVDDPSCDDAYWGVWFGFGLALISFSLIPAIPIINHLFKIEPRTAKIFTRSANYARSTSELPSITNKQPSMPNKPAVADVSFEEATTAEDEGTSNPLTNETDGTDGA